MKSKTSKLMIGIIFLAGLSLLLYPFVANQWNNYRQKQLISSYEQTVSQKEASNGIDYDAELKKAEAYNEALLPSILPDSFAIADASEEDQTYMNTLNIAGDEMMGIVEIPKIDIKRRCSEAGRRSSGRKLPSDWWQKYTFRYLRTPWTSQCISFYRSGSAEKRGSFSDPCIKQNLML